METFKPVIGFGSIFITIAIFLQSCASSMGDEHGFFEGNSGSIGALVAILVLVAGIEAISARYNKIRGIFALVLYALAGLLAITARGNQKDLFYWGLLCLSFAAFFLVATLAYRKQEKVDSAEVKEKGKTKPATAKKKK